MNVTLISPYTNIDSFGIRTLSACLKKEGYEVHLIFLPKVYTEKYEDTALNELVALSKGSTLIGISLMTNFFDNAVQITRKLKENSNAPVIWGGIHPTIRPQECLDYADIVCIGEGEETLLELVRRMEKRQDYHNIQGMWFKNKEKIIMNEVRPLIDDLDAVPFPDYECESHYLLANGHIQKLNKKLFSRMTNRVYMTIPTRGCPFGCTYCCNNTYNKMYPSQKTVRKRSIGNVIEELIMAKNKMPFIEYIKFDDDSFFTYTIQEIADFAKIYKSHIRLPLQISGATPSTLTREKLSLLVDAGLTYIRMGIQTGSQRTKEMYRRYYSDQQVERAVKVINQFKDKVKPHYDIILDNPWETEKDLIETLNFLSRLPVPYDLSLYSLTFYPGTELYLKAKSEGIIEDDLRDVYRKSIDYKNYKKNYFDRLFFLLREYALIGRNIPPHIISLLTNQTMRKLKLNWLLYFILKACSILQRIIYLFVKVSKKIGNRFEKKSINI